jgi:serine/threonine protein phosphatase PrpC
MQTDRGRVRDHNEDYVIRREPDSKEDEKEHGWLYIVADGVGGADAGEVASEYASEQTVVNYITSNDDPNLGQRLVNAMKVANTDLRQLVAERNENKRMATTMVATAITGQIAYIANVGDSRGYHWRNNALRQVTKDQSLVAKLVEEGAITEAEAANHPHRNVILYSIGSEKNPQIDLFEVDLDPGDKILMCSDGLTRHVADQEICDILGSEDLDTAANHLIQLANERGGQDNISAAIIDFGESLADTVIEESAPRVVMPLLGTNGQTAARSRKFLVPYTIFLSIVEAILIVMAWLWLHF